MKRIFPVFGLALWSALNSQILLANVPSSAMPLLPDAERQAQVGEKLSLNFQDIEVRTVLQLLADFTQFNLVVSDAVSGNITLNLQDVPWGQALDLVLESRGLAKRLQGNVMLIAPIEELAARERQTLESKTLLADLLPLRRELLQVNYAKASDIAKLFESLNRGQLQEDERGSIAVDERTNNIIAFQSSERLDEL